MALSIGLDTAVKALRAHQLAVDVASHNIANAHSPGFSRQRVLLRPFGLNGSDHFSRDSLLGRPGMGVDASDVRRVRDMFLDYQLRQVNGDQGRYESQSGILARAEYIFNDPGDDGFSGIIARFWSSWQDVVNDPESAAARTTLVHASTTLATRLQRASSDIEAQRANLNVEVRAIAEEINAAAAEVASLNLQIKQVELNGDVANDLRDRRDLLLDQLSGLAGITYNEQEDSTVTVYIGSHELVIASDYREIVATPDPNPGNPGMDVLTFALDGTVVEAPTGSLRGVYDARDSDLPALLDKLNTFAGTLITEINALHTTGFGLDGTTGVAFFTGASAADIAVNTAIATDPRQVATSSTPGTPGNNDLALQLADIQLGTFAALGNQSFDDYYAGMVSVLGADVNRARGLAESAGTLTGHLDALRQSVSGVSMDEEVTNLAAAQHAYNAAARVITTIDQMLETLINGTGVVGR